MQEIYLDNSATTRVLPPVAEAMQVMLMQEYGNPSSLHAKGVAAEKAVRRARKQVAQVLGAAPEEIFFTSGGTEANNWAVWGTVRQRKGRGKHVITTAIEHPSVLHVFQALQQEGFEVTFLPVDRQGLVDPDELKKALRTDTILVSIMHVNNEIGTVQPLDQLVRLVKEKKENIAFHVDAIQGFGKVSLNVKSCPVDLVTVSGHKINGPKGIGALYIRKGFTIKPLLVGGEQEANLRAGTENVPGIVGLGVAAQLAAERMERQPRMLLTLKERLLKGINSIPGVHINGPTGQQAAPHILNVWFDGIEKGEVLVHMLESKGVYVSTGSACHSRRAEPSHVLQAIGLRNEGLKGAIRISLSAENTAEEMDEAALRLEAAVKEMLNLLG